MDLYRGIDRGLTKKTGNRAAKISLTAFRSKHGSSRRQHNTQRNLTQQSVVSEVVLTSLSQRPSFKFIYGEKRRW